MHFVAMSSIIEATMSFDKLEILDVFCRRIQIGEMCDLGTYRMKFNLGEYSDAYAKFTTALQAKYGRASYIIDSTINILGNTAYWADPKKTLVELPTETLTLETALSYGSIFACDINIYLYQIKVELEQIDDNRKCKVSVGNISIEAASNFTISLASI